MTKNNTKIYDLAIIGAGINGAAIARDAAGRGLSVFICERGTPGCATSSASTKLIHGGLRYLEYYDFKLVREALLEREILKKSAPHMNRLLQFILPYEKDGRPYWMLQAGLYLYDFLAGFSLTLPRSKRISFQGNEYQKILKSGYNKGFIYSDLWTEDNRLVILNLLDAGEKGAEIFIETYFIKAMRQQDYWEVTCREKDQPSFQVKAKRLVNATGPFVHEAQGRIEGAMYHEQNHHIRLVKGSHIVVPKMYDHSHAYLLQSPDGRVVFTIPFEEDFTLIGTTEISCEAPSYHPQALEDEKAYLIDIVNAHFQKQLSAKDIQWSYAGIRPLYEEHDPKGGVSSLSRDYLLSLDEAHDLPLMTIYGGKLTTHRHLAEEVMGRFGFDTKSWTRDALLPGGDLNAETFRDELSSAYPFLTDLEVKRLSASYGTLCHHFLHGKKTRHDLGQEIAPGFFEAEIRYLIEKEWARSVDDLLFKRTKIGVHLTEKKRVEVKEKLEKLF